ncbi:hypothetical protein HELRODRAFT_165282 [Helobdella robusta]|uniref:Endonuclease/exonuclease/phosphatase domain-containing protein n=1 Tax=Helobdella robusta TaxID=6412 RepID=T1EWJ1_HELRO|nr:hypothetical protein HELRODRAFT_165282 [Helobdella robusta]ESN91280.1 hypothetical protein HELRODRAFT_165282 [Helobdella robusta]
MASKKILLNEIELLKDDKKDKLLLKQRGNKNFTFDVIAVTETWLDKDKEELINMNNYKFLGKNRSFKAGGGAGFYIQNEIQYTVRTDLNNLKKLDEVLMRVSNENKQSVLMGDFNIDMLKEENNTSNSFRQLILSFNMHQMINMPTRISTNRFCKTDSSRNAKKMIKQRPWLTKEVTKMLKNKKYLFKRYIKNPNSYSKLMSNGQLLDSPEESLNKYFTELAQNLRNSLPKSSIWKDMIIKTVNVPNSFFLLETSSSKIIEVTKLLKSKSSYGYDHIPMEIMFSHYYNYCNAKRRKNFLKTNNSKTNMLFNHIISKKLEPRFTNGFSCGYL